MSDYIDDLQADVVEALGPNQVKWWWSQTDGAMRWHGADGVVHKAPGTAGTFNLTSVYGAKLDCVYLTDGAMTVGASGSTLGSTQATFAAADVGKRALVQGAGPAGAQLSATIATFVDAHHVTLSVACSTTVAGAQVNYGTDDTAAWQAALNVPNCVIVVPAGRSLITSGLVCAKQGVWIRGSGGSYTADVGNYALLGASWLVWGGNTGGVMLTASPPAGVGGPALKSFKVTDLSFDARNGDQNNAGVALFLQSCHGWHVEDCFVMDAATAAIDFNVLPAGSLGEAHDCTRGQMTRVAVRVLDGPAAAAVGLRMDGSATANACCSKFEQVEIVHANGVAVKLLNADSNVFDKLTVNRAGGGTGVGVEFNGSAASQAGTARNNTLLPGCSPGPGGVVFRAAGLAFGAGDNYVLAQETGNGEPQPYQEPGGALTAASRNFWGTNGVGNGGLSSSLVGNTAVDQMTGGRTYEILANPGLATFSATGTAAPTSSITTATNADNAVAPRVNALSGIVANVANGLITALTIARMDWKPDVVQVVGMGASATDFAACRVWVGMASADLAAVDTPAAQHVAAFRFATAVDGTNFWRTVTCDGTAATVTVLTAAAAALAADATYKLRIQWDVTYATGAAVPCVRFFINDVVVAEHTTHLPLAGVGLGWQWRHVPTTTAAKNGRFSRVKIALTLPNL